MSRVIDEEKPLSADDRAFLMQNGQENRVRMLDEKHGLTPVTSAFVTGLEPSRLTGQPVSALINAPGVSPMQVASALGDPQMLLGSFSKEQLEAELERRETESPDGIGADDVPGEGGEDASRAATEVVREDEEDVPPYEDWKATTLKAQLGVRELSKSGNKDELVTRLRDDDEDESSNKE